jgi:hypothetical protein
MIVSLSIKARGQKSNVSVLGILGNNAAKNAKKLPYIYLKSSKNSKLSAICLEKIFNKNQDNKFF